MSPSRWPEFNPYNLHGKERANSCKVFFDLHIHAVAFVHTNNKLIKRYNKNVVIRMFTETREYAIRS